MASKPHPTYRNSNRTMLLLLLTCFILVLLPDSVYSLKSEYLSPAARRFRLERRRNASNISTRTSSGSRPLSHPSVPRSSMYIAISAFNSGVNTRASPLLARQIDNESCNNITITPPGFDGSCSVAEPCPNGACWFVLSSSLSIPCNIN